MIELLKNFTKAPKSDGSFFISIEGIEGSGKSTQMNYIKDYLESIGKRVVLTREPGGTDFSEKLRSAILNSSVEIAPIAEAHLFAAARAQHLHEKILPELLIKNTVVMADRFIDSSFAYQGKARKLGIETILRLHTDYPLTVLPDLTLYFSIDYKTSIKRQKIRGEKLDYFEKNNKQFYLSLIDGYNSAASIFPHRVKTIDATKMPDEVSKVVSSILKKELF